MSITFHNQLFYLQAPGFDLVLGLLPTGHLADHYMGAPLHLCREHLEAQRFRRPQNRGLSIYTTPGSFEVPLGHEQLAFPTAYSGDFREPAFLATTQEGHKRFDLIYKAHRLYKGGFTPSDLPHLRLSDSTAETLEIDVFDDVHQLTVTLCYTVLQTTQALAMGVKIHNGGQGTLSVEKLMSACIALPDANWQLLQLSGDWLRERQLVRRHLNCGRQGFGSTRGASSAHHNPFAALARPETNESQGQAIGMSAIYSGSFMQSIEVDEDGQLRWMTGIHPETFTWQLKPNGTFETPQVVIGYSQNGLNGLSQVFHRLVNQHLIPPKWATTPRPIVLNNWEATYFNFDEKTLLALADKAKAVGVELFVLDDGWFSTRNDDLHGLGDWRVNTEKLPSGLIGLASAIKDKGLEFGLWIEPEMVNDDTPLFLEHPEWVVGHWATPNTSRSLAQARNQYVLDFSNPQVVNHIYDQLIAVLDPLPLSYIKWDMNRNLSEGFTSHLPADQMGEFMHRYMLGVYSLYHRLTRRYPELLIESCSAGGARFDLGMFYYAPQAWASDNSDAVSRLSIQYGTSIAYPISAMGAHISAVPNHQIHRHTPLAFRSAVSFFGAFGIELNLLEADELLLMDLKHTVAFYKRFRELLHRGTFYRLLGPFANGPAGLYGQSAWQQHYGQPYAWQVLCTHGQEGLVAKYQPLAYPNAGPTFLKLQGLVAHHQYRVVSCDDYSTTEKCDFVATGAHLMQMGILVMPPFNGIEKTHASSGDYVSHLWYIQHLRD